MILGTEARVRPSLERVEGSSTGGHHDRDHYLSPRLHPAAPFDPWQPASSCAPPSADSYEEAYAVASESM
jgi:hypothetical protein